MQACDPAPPVRCIHAGLAADGSHRKKQAWVRLPCLLVWMEHRCPAFGGGGCHDGASQRWQSQVPDAEVKTVLAVVVTEAGLVPEAYRACHGW